MNEFNEYFSTIGSKINNQFPTNEEYNDIKGPKCMYSFKLFPTNIANVLKGFSKFSNNSSLDILDFDSKLLKYCRGKVTGG